MDLYNWTVLDAQSHTLKRLVYDKTSKLENSVDAPSDLMRLRPADSRSCPEAWARCYIVRNVNTTQGWGRSKVRLCGIIALPVLLFLFFWCVKILYVLDLLLLLLPLHPSMELSIYEVPHRSSFPLRSSDFSNGQWSCISRAKTWVALSFKCVGVRHYLGWKHLGMPAKASGLYLIFENCWWCKEELLRRRGRNKIKDLS